VVECGVVCDEEQCVGAVKGWPTALEKRCRECQEAGQVGGIYVLCAAATSAMLRMAGK
jgi:hypothetical protein